MRLRSISTIAGALVLSAASVDAAPAEGWLENGSTLVHEKSGARCPAELDDLQRTRLEPAANATLGVCVYGDDEDQQGLIRVRRYVAGAGETPLAIQNDAKLMEPSLYDPNVVAAYRGGPGPERNGKPTRQFVVTFVVGSHLVDCILRQRAEDESKTHDGFVQACMKAQPR